MFKDKLRIILNKNDEKDINGNNKKKIENLVFLVIILIITIVIINYVWNGDKTSDKVITNSAGKQLATKQNSSKATENNQVITSSDDLETRLENILKCINGVGDVKVFINYSETSETVAMYNENSKSSITEETDTSGGVRKVETIDSQKEVVYQENDGEKSPIIQKMIEPKIQGAIITAKGASDINIKTNIIQAVEAATGLATHKIQVFEMSLGPGPT